jgi:CO/xanthine dehydrogenase FAD-binding subunit
MAEPLSQIFFPSAFNELFSAWNRFPAAIPYAGGTGIVRGQGKETFDLPPIILCLDKLDELHHITRTEHYLEIGAMVNLNQIIRVGKIVPEVLTQSLENIAGPQLRNIATIGGNICFPGRRLDCWAPLSALDAQFELRSAQTSRWVSAARLCSLQGTALEPRELLTRIRVPLDQWDYSIYRKFTGLTEKSGESVVFIMKTQKNILTDIRIVFKTDVILRDKNSEAILIGKQLPLSRRIADDFIKNWKAFLQNFQNITELSQKRFINCIEQNVYNLSE